MKDQTRSKIFSHVRDKTIEIFKRRSDEPKSGNPFTKALLPNIDPRTLAFERSFSTSFGQATVERMALWVAEDNGSTAERQRNTTGTVTESQLQTIGDIRRSLRRKGSDTRPDWGSEVGRITMAKTGNPGTIAVNSDLYVRKPDGTEQFFSIKSPKANLDQTMQAKEDCLKLKAIDPGYEPYFALHHNPFGEDLHDYDWGFTLNIFDLHSPALLIGEDFWNLLGGQGTYQELLQIFREVNLELEDEIDDFFA